jgi:ATP-dependent Lon protease
MVGLAWTPTGGDVLYVEANAMKGGKGFTMTGHVGQVMQESMQAALAWVRSHATDYDIDPEFFQSKDIHIHVPSGAIPKDGPSAGVTMVSALVSALTRRPARQRVAMTGEITLSGQVLPVGGIKEKVLAAKRAGVVEVILPADNEPNVHEDLNPEMLEGLTLHYVKTIREAAELGLEKDSVPAEMDRLARNVALTPVAAEAPN